VTVSILTSLPTSDGTDFLTGELSRPKGLFVADGDHSALKDPAVPWGLLRRAGRPGVLLPDEVVPGFPCCSLVFLFVPSRPLSRLLGGGKPGARRGISAGQGPVAMVR